MLYKSDGRQAYSWLHVKDVYKRMLTFTKMKGFKINKNILLITATLVDMCVYFDDLTQHGQSASNFFIMYAKQFFHDSISQETINEIVYAVNNHRTSTKVCCPNQLVRTTRVATMPPPVYENILNRSVIFLNEKYNLFGYDAMNSAKQYILNKYGSDGYVKYSSDYYKLHGYEAVNELRSVIDVKHNDGGYIIRQIAKFVYIVAFVILLIHVVGTNLYYNSFKYEIIITDEYGRNEVRYYSDAPVKLSKHSFVIQGIKHYKESISLHKFNKSHYVYKVINNNE
jgi:hypothetical protein